MKLNKLLVVIATCSFLACSPAIAEDSKVPPPSGDNQSTVTETGSWIDAIIDLFTFS